MPIFDFKCPDCHTHVDDVAVPSTTAHPPFVYLCPQCGEPMERLAAAPHFVVTGYSAKNGYSAK